MDSSAKKGPVTKSAGKNNNEYEFEKARGDALKRLAREQKIAPVLQASEKEKNKPVITLNVFPKKTESLNFFLIEKTCPDGLLLFHMLLILFHSRSPNIFSFFLLDSPLTILSIYKIVNQFF